VINMRATCVLFASVVGCATPASVLRDDNRRLSQSVTELRADRRTQERKLRDLEHQLAMVKEKTVAPDMPQLPVEVLAPARSSAASATDQRVVAVADDGTEIIYEGDAALGKAATLDDDPPAPPARRPISIPPSVRAPDPVITSATDHLEVTRHVPPVTSAARRRTQVRVDHDAVPANDGPAIEYRAAVELVKAGKHDEAVAALRAFLKAYPRHDYADNAQYWLGESFYAQKDYTHALGEFRATIETYPRGNKVPDALLKVGYCYGALGQAEKARAVLEQVVNLYPKSEPAALATKRLETP
jgi:tol-pal system protein YbgF